MAAISLIFSAAILIFIVVGVICIFFGMQIVLNKIGYYIQGSVIGVFTGVIICALLSMYLHISPMDFTMSKGVWIAVIVICAVVGAPIGNWMGQGNVWKDPIRKTPKYQKFTRRENVRK